MTAVVLPVEAELDLDKPKHRRRHDPTRAVSSPWATVVAIVIATVWTVPTVGLLITSFRPEIDITRSGWWTVVTDPDFTLSNYEKALSGSGSSSMLDYFVNSFVITIPSTLFPLALAALAAYGFAWLRFPGRDWLFVAVFALQVVPLQVALVPLMQMYGSIGIDGSYWTVWISHTIFGLPLAVFMMFNTIRDLPPALVEAATIDGASPVQIFLRIVLPLATPAITAYGIFQFLWTWNDLLVSMVFLGGSSNVAPLTVYISQLSGSRGSAWYLLSSGAFISMIVPVVVFLIMQRYFVRGLTAGAVK
ncbi:carbohydrate ABC transporter permease [Propionimicrobium sp. PCR01-08-3]|uniref:carbohydrate ABC transporter permease n=1 Tax=Propionimicrobium sp. PCR01-08-3 TaxID=3052086 RepID=UPI00255CA250|nr:carbohydrate ABC transporter permease [Propionimicrobium sp. PCR01-08-3]WIY82415.1 carbohydrate ABC transporter permease [Propionimicrobium sp. PCR01-08-3]